MVVVPMRRSQAKFLANIVKVKGTRFTLPAKRGAESNAARSEKRLKEEVPSQPAQGSKQEEEEEEEGPALAGLLGDKLSHLGDALNMTVLPL